MKKCYECGKDMVDMNIVQGMLKYDILQNRALNEGWEFEGWVHVSGVGDECFVREKDSYLSDLYLQEGAKQNVPDDEMDIGLMDRLIVCEDCVQHAYEQEWISLESERQRLQAEAY